MNAIRMPLLNNAACTNAKPSEAVCLRCPDRPDCLVWALEHEEFGYWAGHTATARERLRTTFGIELDRIWSGA